jgi:mannitol-specific phosphotransferase system IIBC component
LDALTVILPVPDGAMPFNATAMACVAFVAHLGALAKILLKRENYDDKAKTLQHLAKVERKRLKSEEKKAKSNAEKRTSLSSFTSSSRNVKRK